MKIRFSLNSEGNVAMQQLVTTEEATPPVPAKKNAKGKIISPGRLGKPAQHKWAFVKEPEEQSICRANKHVHRLRTRLRAAVAADNPPSRNEVEQEVTRV